MLRSPTRPIRKASSPAKAKMENFIKWNPKESDFKTVTIKKEALDSVVRKTKQPTSNLVKKLTPNINKKGRKLNKVVEV